MSRIQATVLAIVLATVTVARVASTWTVFSATMDEPIHVRAGLEKLTSGTYESDVEHPPLARVAFAVDSFLRGTPQDQLFLNEALYRRDLAGMRAGNLPFLLLSLAVVFFWTKRLFDSVAAVVAVALFGALPPVLAHAGLATTDMAAAATIAAALYALSRWTEEQTLSRVSILGVAIGFGLLSKYSFVLFFGLGAVVFLLARRPRNPGQLALAALIGGAIVFAGLGFDFGTMVSRYPANTSQGTAARYAKSAGYEWVRADHLDRYRRFAMDVEQHTGYGGIDFVDWARAAGYPSPLAGRNGFDTMAKAPPLPLLDARTRRLEPFRRARHWFAATVPLPAPLFLVGLERVSQHSEDGHPAVLLGEYRDSGWWYYFPVVIFYKTPMPFLILAILGMAIVVKRQPALAVVPLLLLLFLMTTRLNIGVRHALPLYPLMTPAAAFAAIWLWRSGRFLRVSAVVLLLWFFIPAAVAHPDYLAWFNEAAGSHPESIAVDSNLDWGQDLLRLRDHLRAAGIENAHIACLRPAGPSALRIPGVFLPPDNRCVEGWTAISETLRLTFHHSYAWLDAYEPVRRVGRSIRIYDIPACR